MPVPTSRLMPVPTSKEPVKLRHPSLTEGHDSQVVTRAAFEVKGGWRDRGWVVDDRPTEPPPKGDS